MLTSASLKSGTKPVRTHILPKALAEPGTFICWGSRPGAAALDGFHVLNAPLFCFFLLVQQSKEKASSCRVLRGQRRGVGQVQQAAVVALPCHL